VSILLKNRGLPDKGRDSYAERRHSSTIALANGSFVAGLIVGLRDLGKESGYFAPADFGADRRR
jgi:hypothetical protein